MNFYYPGLCPGLITSLNDMPVLRHFPLHIRRGSNWQILLKVDSAYEIESSFTGLEV